jgi:hypothetical protein
MKKVLFAAASAALLGISAPAFAQGASSTTPGHEMQEKGSVKGSPGASGYAPGHQMDRDKGLSEGRASAIDRDRDRDDRSRDRDRDRDDKLRGDRGPMSGHDMDRDKD